MQPLLELRHKLQAQIAGVLAESPPVAGSVAEVDEMYQNAGKKDVPYTRPEDPPRRRANKVRCHGTWENDRAAGGRSGRAPEQRSCACASASTPAPPNWSRWLSAL